MPGRSLPVNLCWLKLNWKLPHNKGSQVQMFRIQTKHQQQQNSDLRAESEYSLHCSLWNGRTQVLCEAAFNRVLEALGMRGYVLKGNFHQSRHPTHKINHADYEFCACIYFLMGKRSDVSILCHVGWRNKRLGEGSSGYTHNKIFSYIKWTGCQGEKKNPQNMCFQSYDWKTHKALERETDYVP